jgi:hypothetical protein
MYRPVGMNFVPVALVRVSQCQSSNAMPLGHIWKSCSGVKIFYDVGCKQIRQVDCARTTTTAHPAFVITLPLPLLTIRPPSSHGPRFGTSSGHAPCPSTLDPSQLRSAAPGRTHSRVLPQGRVSSRERPLSYKAGDMRLQNYCVLALESAHAPTTVRSRLFSFLNEKTIRAMVVSFFMPALAGLVLLGAPLPVVALNNQGVAKLPVMGYNSTWHHQPSLLRDKMLTDSLSLERLSVQH